MYMAWKRSAAVKRSWKFEVIGYSSFAVKYCFIRKLSFDSRQFSAVHCVVLSRCELDFCRTFSVVNTLFLFSRH